MLHSDHLQRDDFQIVFRGVERNAKPIFFREKNLDYIFEMSGPVFQGIRIKCYPTLFFYYYYLK